MSSNKVEVVSELNEKQTRVEILEKKKHVMAPALKTALGSMGVQDLSHTMAIPAEWHVRPEKTQISLGIRPVWSESSLCAHWVAKDPRYLYADSEDPDQIGWLPRLIWLFAGRISIKTYVVGIHYNFVVFVVLWLIYILLISDRVNCRWGES